MLSKEEKLKYGEALRQQMKEKQARKRQEDLSKRAVVQVLKSQSDRILAIDPPFLDPKEALQQKLENNDYNPFGKAGGGAPNIRQPNHSSIPPQQNRSVLPGYSSQEYIQTQSYAPETYNQYPSYPNSDQRNLPSHIISNESREIQPVTSIAPQETLEYRKPAKNHPMQHNPNEYHHQLYQPEAVHQYVETRNSPQQRSYPQPIQYMNQGQQRGYPEHPPRMQPERMQRQANQQQYQQPQGRSGLYRQDYSQPQLNNERTLAIQMQDGGRQRIKTLQNQQLQEVYKKGGRNLLRLQNQTMNEHLVKQKQKLQMQAFLKQQMEQAERRKQEERQKIKREEMEEERRNREYIEMQNQKLKDEERKKVQEKQRLVEQNLRNLERKKQLQQEAKLKIQKEAMQKHLREQLEIQKQRQRQRQAQTHEVRLNRPREDSSSSISETSSEQNTYSKGFNTNISRDFVKKEREREAERGKNDKKLQLFTAQIQKMREEILNQGDTFQKEIEKIKREAERAQDQKRKAELEVEKLRLELEKKNKESELRLLEALKRNNPYTDNLPSAHPPRTRPLRREHQPYQNQANKNDYFYQNEEDDELDRRPYAVPSKLPPSPKKPMAKINKVYQHNSEYQEHPRPLKKQQKWEKEFNLEQSNIGTLDADSKKIPLNLQPGTKLTISSIQNFGKQSFSYGASEPQLKRFQEQQGFSRGSKRSERDQLDRLVDRNEKKWELSTVKDDITQEIQELLKKKDNHEQFKPTSMSRAGRHVLSRGGLPYEGPALGTLNSNKASLVSDNGTLDIDKIHGRNEARLRQLKALGVQTINTNNDDDLNRLNALLNNYN